MKTLTNAMTEIATWSNNKVSIVTHAALEANCPELLHSHQERTARKADNPDLMSVYEHNGTMLMNAADSAIWLKSIKCTLTDGRVFFFQEQTLTMGGGDFQFSTLVNHWLGEPDAKLEIIDNEPAWEVASYDRITGLRSGSIVVAEHGHNDRVLMVSESAFSLEDIKRNVYYNECHHEPWTKIRSLNTNINAGYTWLKAHAGKRVCFAKHGSSTVYIYITA